MYYPLLRSRQFELITLRELANENATQGFVMPIIEPVKETHNNLNLAFDVFEKMGQKAYLIVNPENGEMSGDGTHYLDYLEKKPTGVFLPAFRYRLNGKYILDAIQDYNLNEVMIICSNEVGSDNSDFTSVATSASVTAFNVGDPDRNRSLKRYLFKLGKIFIRLDDPFERQTRNSDFLSIGAHPFTEEHLYYKEEGFYGFSDYTVLPSEYIEGGSTPRAVVIHLTYLFKDKQIWIRHFTSTTNDSIANVQGKFAEAAEKAVKYCHKNNLSNTAIKELISHYDEQHYPGLGTIKKISMKNHILVVVDYLRNK
ncbi:MAG: sce7725 family protein [Bacteroidales bacterium]|nr:sce7725 family protein [Bacteroidales bacterium]